MKYVRICVFCGKEFSAYKSCTQYCSARCAKLASKERCRARVREEVIAKDHQMIISEYTKKDIFTIRESMNYLGISRSTLFRYIRSGVIPCMNLGNAVRLKRTDLDNLFEKRLPYTREEKIVNIAKSKIEGVPQKENKLEDITDKYISRKQMCEILGICDATAWKMTKKHKLECVMFGSSKYYRRDQIENLAKRRNKDPYPEITDWISREEIKEIFSMTDNAIYNLVSDRCIPSKPHKGSSVLYSRKHFYEAKHVGIDFKKEYYNADEVMKLMGINRNQLHNRLRRSKIKIRRMTVNRILWINKKDFNDAYGDLE